MKLQNFNFYLTKEKLIGDNLISVKSQKNSVNPNYSFYLLIITKVPPNYF